MAPLPKRRHSTARSGRRRAAGPKIDINHGYCRQCGSAKKINSACAQCGYYNPKITLTTKIKKEKKIETEK